MAQNYMYSKGGDNTFMPDTDDVQLPGKIGLMAIGGIVKHLGALTAIGCSTVNSYRLWDTGFWAPVFSDWGFQNRTTGLRVSAPGRFEYRAVDAMVNPHLMAAALIMAMDDGIKNKLDPGPSEERNIYQAMEAGKQVKRLPMTLGDALAALEKDPVIRSAMPGEMYRLYDEYKRDEWERFLHTTTEWDIKTYLDCLPWRLANRGATSYVRNCRPHPSRRRDQCRREMTAMLKSLKHRGPDSTGFAIYGASVPNEYVMRLKLAEQEDMTKDHHIRRRSGRARPRSTAPCRAWGRDGRDRRGHALRLPLSPALRRRHAGAHDRDRTDRRGRGPLRLGARADQGPWRCVGGLEQYGLGGFRGTHGIGHTRMATESTSIFARPIPTGPIPTTTSPSCITARSPITGSCGARWSGSDTASCRIAIWSCSRSTPPTISRRGNAGGFAELPDQGHRRRVHLCRGDRERARHGQGHHGRQADGPLRERQPRRARLRGGRHSRHHAARDRHVRSL